MSELSKMAAEPRFAAPDQSESTMEQGGHSAALPDAQRHAAVQLAANNSAPVKQLMAFQAAANTSRQVSQLKALQAAANPQPVQRKANDSGLPDDLRSGIEQLSGVSMDGVNVHMNSDKPAQMQAHAYAQGSDIHIAPGQEQHLPHEAWHVAQQRQGRVQATTQVGGAAVNDSPVLEQEADTMGAKALQMKAIDTPDLPSDNPTSRIAQRQAAPVAQRMIAINDDLYANSVTSGLAADTQEGGLTLEQKRAAWITNLGNFTGKTVTDITPINFLNRFNIPGPLRHTVLKKLSENNVIHNYYFAGALSDEALVEQADVARILNPVNLFVEPDDLNAVYDPSKACVLQALVNAGMTKDGVEDPTSAASWHEYYYNGQGIQYDEDVNIYAIYTELGMELVHNNPMKWSDLALANGTYIFSSPGHNFCVVKRDGATKDDQYLCRDEPQRRQLRYEADLMIHYAWKKP